MYEDVCYKKPFLKGVIFRADFPTLVQGVEKRLSAEVSKSILCKFPLSEPQKAHAQEFQFLVWFQLSSKNSEIMQWIFHNQDRNRTLAITQNAFSYTSRKYKTYENLLEDIDAPLKEFFETTKILLLAS